MKDSNREAFESWATDKFPIAGLGQFEKHNNGTYLQRSIRNMYEAWQAAKAQAVPEGFVVVPKVATKQMVNAGYEAHDGFFTNGAVQDVYVAMIEAAQEKNQ